ncbi:MAG: hypothetical protein KBT10_10450 [Bacteroidales bacterium]|nr:hypothetical protein [Candidatus Sodaliphilus aphodohippi]
MKLKRILSVLVLIIAGWAIAAATVVVVDGVNVRLRLGPSTNYGMLTNSHGRPVYPAKGTRLTYYGTYGNFYKVSYNGYTVYISRDFSHLSNTGSSSYNNGRRNTTRVVVVDGVHVRLRHGPSTSYGIFTDSYGRPVYPARGARLPYLGTYGNFYKVNYNGYTVYISRDYTHLK